MTDAGGGRSRWDGRRRAREAALQMLYQCEIGRLAARDAAAVLRAQEAADGPGLDEADRHFAETLASGAWADRVGLDGRIGEAARRWRVERMAAIDRQVLRLAVHELLAHPATPPRVVLDEAIELAREYSGEDAAKFVNGVLDGVLKKLVGEGKVVE